MRIAVITVAGISGRFNEETVEEEKQLKAIYHNEDSKDTLLLHLVKHCASADEIIIVGGFKYENLKAYVETELIKEVKSRITVVFNPHFNDLASGYSLYVGLQEAFHREKISEILFLEGDLDIDRESFHRVVETQANILTYNTEPIYSQKAVVLYRTEDNRYHYAFSPSHGLLKIDEPFSCVLNSGQFWKFIDIDILEEACNVFFTEDRNGSNLRIIQEYLNRILPEEVIVLRLDRWMNCNTREEFRIIGKRWEKER